MPQAPDQTIQTTLKYFLPGLLAFILFAQCKTKTEKSAETPIPYMSKFDSIVRDLKEQRELVRDDLLALKVIDTFYSYRSAETSYCDTTVQLSDSSFYSIIDVNDSGGTCTHVFIVTIDEKNKRALASKYLEPVCDIDYSMDSYELYEHKIISRYSILLTKTTVFQKKDKILGDEEQNIDHKVIETRYFIISPEGQINIVER